jgi:endonuclease III
MPYIEKQNREKFNDLIDNVFINLDDKNWEGELNYIFSMLIKNVLDTNQRKNYKNINAAIGVLECCKQELYRMTAAPYEDLKIIINGNL